MLRRYLLPLLLLFLLLPLPLSAAIVHLHENQPMVDTAGYLEHLQDPTAQLSPAEANDAEAGRGYPETSTPVIHRPRSGYA